MKSVAVASFLDLCLDATSLERMVPFWAEALGAEVAHRQEGAVQLRLPRNRASVWINEVPELNLVKNRVHLDVHCGSVDELLELGATVVREPGEHDSWWSLRSPDGDELCGFVREEVPANRLYEVVVDAVDARAQADWWRELLGGDVSHEDGGAFLSAVPGLPCEYLVFQPVPEQRTVKNRAHWDVRAEIGAVIDRGATVLRPPTATSAWHVVADPEGNEFCVFPL